MAQAYTEFILKKWRVKDIRVRSSGVEASSSFEVPCIVKEILAKAGVKLSRHVAKRTNIDLVRTSDLIIVMEIAHKKKLMLKFLEAAEKFVTFKDFAGMSKGNVADPMGQPEAAYREAFRLIKEGSEKIARKIANINARA